MTESAWKLDLGAEIGERGTRFRIWAPKVPRLALKMVSGKRRGTIPLQEEENGYFSGSVEGVVAGDRYLFISGEGSARPDPVSRFQPEGVHGASQVVDPQAFRWRDAGWSGISLEDYVIYELHVGTFTREGTFAAVIPFLDYLKDLGVTAVELMPVAQFPGSRNWGYDGVYQFAPQNSYGGPDGLKQLVDACHAMGLAVILDVVYNHFGPEGNYLGEFGFYFTDHYRTPWGDALNFDGPYSDQVRAFFIANALYWVHEFHIDALRLDAIDKIYDFGARHFLQELAVEVHRYRDRVGRKIHLIAESDLNDARLLLPPEIGGHGIDAQWNDNFHHAVHSLLTGESTGYYVDFGRLSHMVKAFDEGFVYSGEYSVYRKKRHGSSVRERPTSQLVVFSQNHDQVGNRMLGDRLGATQPVNKLMLAAGLVILSPYLPLIFMGEEYGEKAPFLYFVSYSDPALIEAVRRGRKEEFSSFAWEGEPVDPQDDAAFLRSKIDMNLPKQGEQALLLKFYRQLLALRRNIPAFKVFSRKNILVTSVEENKIVAIRRNTDKSSLLCIYSFADERQEVPIFFSAGNWKKILDSSSVEWGGPGEVVARTLTASEAAKKIGINPYSVMVFHKSD